VANPNPSPATRFKPGNSFSVGNGRPQGSSIRARIRALAAQDTGDGKTIEDRIAEKFIIEALKGKHPFAHDVLEAIDGKIPDKVQVESIASVEISLSRLSSDDLDQFECLARKLLGGDGSGADPGVDRAGEA
jgi:hypothetical protein